MIKKIKIDKILRYRGTKIIFNKINIILKKKEIKIKDFIILCNKDSKIMSKQTYYNYLYGYNDISINKLVVICNLLNININELLKEISY